MMFGNTVSQFALVAAGTFAVCYVVGLLFNNPNPAPRQQRGRRNPPADEAELYEMMAAQAASARRRPPVAPSYLDDRELDHIASFIDTLKKERKEHKGEDPFTNEHVMIQDFLYKSIEYHFDKSKPEKAVRPLELLLDLSLEMETWSLVSFSANLLGLICSRTGAPAKAINYYEQALAVPREYNIDADQLRVIKQTEEDLIALYLQSAQAYAKQGKRRECFAELRKITTIIEQNLGQNSSALRVLLTKSRNLTTTSATITRTPEGDALCAVRLQANQPAPDGALLVCSVKLLEKEDDVPVEIELAPHGSAEFAFNAPIPAPEEGYYVVQIDAYSDAARHEKLLSHIQLIKYAISQA